MMLAILFAFLLGAAAIVVGGFLYLASKWGHR